MDFRGYGGSRGAPPPEAYPPHLQEQNSSMQDRYYEEQSYTIQERYPDPRSFFHQRPAGHEYPHAQGPSFWHQDAPSRPDAPFPPYPPSYPSVYGPQHESGFFPPPFPPESSQFSPYFSPQSSFGGTDQYYSRGSPQSSSFGQSSQYHRQVSPPSSGSFGESAHFPPHSSSHSSSSFGEHAQPEIRSVSEHRDYFKVPSFENQAGSPSVQAGDLPSFGRSSRSYGYPSAEEEMPAALQRGHVLGNESLSSADAELPRGQLVKIFCKHSRKFNLAVDDDRVVMMETNPEDEFQQWIRDDRYSIRVRDDAGHPAFMLINKGSKKALKHGPGQLEEVQLTNYTLGVQDDDLFWTESQDYIEGFRTVRKASDTLLNLSVSCGNNIENGCVLILDTWHKTDNQLWKMFPI